MKRTKTLWQSSVTVPFHPETDGATQTAPQVDMHEPPVQPKFALMVMWLLPFPCL